MVRKLKRKTIVDYKKLNVIKIFISSPNVIQQQKKTNIGLMKYAETTHFN